MLLYNLRQIRFWFNIVFIFFVIFIFDEINPQSSETSSLDLNFFILFGVFNLFYYFLFALK